MKGFIQWTEPASSFLFLAVNPLNAVKILNSMDLLLTYIIVMEGDQFNDVKNKSKDSNARDSKGSEFSALNSRYRNQNLLHEDLKDTKIYTFFFQH